MQKSSMQLEAHSDAGYLNEKQGKSCASAYTCMSETAPTPSFNGAAITIAKIMKHIMLSTAEAELASLFIAAKKCV